MAFVKVTVEAIVDTSQYSDPLATSDPCEFGREIVDEIMLSGAVGDIDNSAVVGSVVLDPEQYAEWIRLTSTLPHRI